MAYQSLNGKRPFGMRIKSSVEFLVLLSVDLAALALVFRLSSYIRANVLPHLLQAYSLEFLHGSLSDVWWMFPIWLFFLM